MVLRMSTLTVTCVGLALSLLAAAGARVVSDGACGIALPNAAAGTAVGSGHRVGAQAADVQAVGARA